MREFTSQPRAVKSVNFLLSLGVIALLLAMIFKYLPDTEIAWSDVWIGAAVASLFVTTGKALIGLYRQVHRRVSIRSGGIPRHYSHLGLLLSTDFPFRRGSHARLRLQARLAGRRKACVSSEYLNCPLERHSQSQCYARRGAEEKAGEQAKPKSVPQRRAGPSPPGEGRSVTTAGRRFAK